MDIEEELEHLEEEFENTEQEFEEVKDRKTSGEKTDKEEKASELIQEIRGQLEFLRDQIENTEDF
ncbi:MAG: hypothetical protein ACLFTA_03650 [Candidatus Nanohaloarchaea archaeon]